MSSKTPFLRQIARLFYREHRDELYRYAFYFQNRRAGLFFLRYLEEEAEGDGEAVFFLPRVTTLTDELYRLAGVEKPDPNDDIFVVYEIFRAIAEAKSAGGDGEDDEGWNLFKAEQFSDFYRLGTYILNDFNDIDKQLEDPDKIYRLSDEQSRVAESFRPEFTDEEVRAALLRLGAKGVLTPPAGEESRYRMNFRSLFSILPSLYRKTKERLREKRLYYSGMLMRDAVTGEGEVRFEPGAEPETIPVIVGLSSLSKAEKALLDKLRDEASAIFYWDYPELFFNSREDLLGLGEIMRENLSRYKMPEDPAYHIDFEPVTELPRVEVTAVPSKAGQTVFITDNRFTAEYRRQGSGMRERVERLEAAIVLPNERLLIPLLGNLPGGDIDINVTMGYPLKETPLAGMLLRLLQILRQVRERGAKEQGKAFWMAREVSEILSMKVLEPLFGGAGFGTAVSDYLRKKHLFSLNRDELSQAWAELEKEHAGDEEFLSALRRSEEIIAFPAYGDSEGEQLLAYLQKLVSRLRVSFHKSLHAEAGEEKPEEEQEEDDNKPVEDAETIYAFADELLGERITELFREMALRTDFDFHLASDLLRGLISNARIPYTGEPLKGLQVLGILETRSLDFDTVYIVDATEGILPAHTRLNTLIPYDIREYHHLPTYKWQERTRAYNFFRLISRASRVFACYDSRKNDNAEGEPSRYLRLLRYIFSTPESGQVSFKSASYIVRSSEMMTKPLSKDAGKIVAFRKELQTAAPDPKLLPFPKEGLDRPRFRGLSASSLITFMECPQEFYFRYIERRQQREEPDGLLTALDIGILLHNTLSRLYEGLEGEELTAGNLKPLLEGKPGVREVLLGVFRDAYGNMPLSGHNSFILDGIEQDIRGVIRHDLEHYAGYRYIGGEVHFSGRLRLPRALLSEDLPAEGEIGSDEELLINISGDIDRMLLDPLSGKLHIQDFKTGGDSPVLSVSKATTPDSKSHVVLQLSLYALALSEALRLLRGGTSSCFSSLELKTSAPSRTLLMSAKSIVPEMFKPKEGTPRKISFDTNNEVEDFLTALLPGSSSGELLREWFARSVLQDTAAGILSPESKFDATPKPSSSHCRYCPVYDLCPSAARHS